MQPTQVSIRALLAAIILTATGLALFRSYPNPVLWLVLLVSGSVGGLAALRTTGELARRRSAGLSTTAREASSILLASMAIGTAIIGAADAAFVVVIYVIDNAGPRHPHLVPSGLCPPGVVLGLAAALLVATSVKRTLWVRGLNLKASLRRWARLWPAALIALLGIATVAVELRERYVYCREMAVHHAGPEARAEGPEKAEEHAFYRRYYERAAVRPWLTIRPAPRFYSVSGSRRPRKWLAPPTSERDPGAAAAE